MAAHLKEFLTDRRILFLSTMFIIYFITCLFSSNFQEIWIATVCGIVTFYIIEYIIHRFILHGYFGNWLPKAYKGHEMHHNHPNDIEYLLTPNVYNVTYHIGFGSVAAIVTWNIHIACAFMLGITIYQVYYEWSHFITHRSIVPLTSWGKRMKKFHLLHHFKSADHYFGVTNSSIDTLVGTYPPADAPIIKKAEKL